MVVVAAEAAAAAAAALVVVATFAIANLGALDHAPGDGSIT
jgi:hypothetical protein